MSTACNEPEVSSHYVEWMLKVKTEVTHLEVKAILLSEVRFELGVNFAN